MNGIKAPIYEIFVSYQGEGLFVGQKQIFVRFSSCNLNCFYCDEPASKSKSNLETVDWVVKKIKSLSNKYKIKNISFTGGEPLLYSNFIKLVIDSLGKKYFYLLETNGTLYKNLEKIIDNISFVSMDIKLSSYVNKNLLKEHLDFIKRCGDKVYLKIVFDEKINILEFVKALKNISKIKKDIIVYIQPATVNGEVKINQKLLDRLYFSSYPYIKDLRFLPQVHKLIKLK